MREYIHYGIIFILFGLIVLGISFENNDLQHSIIYALSGGSFGVIFCMFMKFLLEE